MAPHSHAKLRYFQLASPFSGVARLGDSVLPRLTTHAQNLDLRARPGFEQVFPQEKHDPPDSAKHGQEWPAWSQPARGSRYNERPIGETHHQVDGCDRDWRPLASRHLRLPYQAPVEAQWVSQQSLVAPHWSPSAAPALPSIAR